MSSKTSFFGDIFMVNGPMGGNMGTPPAPAQPPQVNFTTTAESRGGFSNFLKIHTDIQRI